MSVNKHQNIKTHMHKKLSLVGLALLALACLSLAPLATPAAIPASGLQFPVYTYGSSALSTNVGTTETNLVTFTIPRKALAPSGFMCVTFFPYSPDGVAQNHTYIGYLNNVPVFTNQVAEAKSGAIQRYILARGTASQITIGDKSTNSAAVFPDFALSTVVDTVTNSLAFRLTGSGTYSTNVFGVDGCFLQVFGTAQ